MYKNGEIFKNLHFTLISLIQGVVLSMIVTQKLPNTYYDTPTFYISALQSSCLFVVILIITYEYFALYTIQNHKNIKFLDVVLPISIGLCQFLLLKFVLEERCHKDNLIPDCLADAQYRGDQLNYWYASFIVLLVIALCAYKNTQKRLKDARYHNLQRQNNRQINSHKALKNSLRKAKRVEFEIVAMLEHVDEEIYFCLKLIIACVAVFSFDLAIVKLQIDSTWRVVNLFCFLLCLIIIASFLVRKGDALVDTLYQHEIKILPNKIYEGYGFFNMQELDPQKQHDTMPPSSQSPDETGPRH